MPGAEAVAAAAAAEAIRRRVRSLHTAGERVTASIGVATVSDANAIDVIRFADGALYRAKEEGRTASRCIRTAPLPLGASLCSGARAAAALPPCARPKAASSDGGAGRARERRPRSSSAYAVSAPESVAGPPAVETTSVAVKSPGDLRICRATSREIAAQPLAVVPVPRSEVSVGVVVTSLPPLLRTSDVAEVAPVRLSRKHTFDCPTRARTARFADTPATTRSSAIRRAGCRRVAASAAAERHRTRGPPAWSSARPP